MRALIVVSLVFALAYLLTRPVFSSRWSSVGLRYLFLSGTEFLLVGWAVGPQGLNLIPPAVLGALDPVVHLALGWAGLIFGLQFNRRMLRLYPAARYGIAFLQALVAAAIGGAGGYAAFRLLFPEGDDQMALRAAAIAAICLAPTAPSSIFYFGRVFALRGRVNRLLKFIAAVDGIPPIALLGVFTGLFHVFAAGPDRSLAGWHWFVIATALGIVLGLLLTALVELEFSRDELLLFVIGMVVLAGGVARYLHLSAVYVSFVMGLTAANAAWHREEVHKVVAYAEKPVYLTFLVLAGTLLVLDDPRVPIFAAALLLLRVIGKIVGNVPWKAARFEPAAESPWLGLALVSQGGLAVVLAFDFEFLYRADLARAEVTQLVVSAVALAVLASEILSPLFLRALFPAGEPAREAA